MPLDTEGLGKIAAAGLASIFAGSALYISAVQHPALTAVEDHIAQAKFFQTMYPKAAGMQASFAVVSGASAIAVYVLEKDRPSGNALVWLSSGCAILAIVPYTIAAMLPLNNQLQDPVRCLKEGPAWMRASLRRWASLHSVRTGVSLAAAVAMLVALASETVVPHTGVPVRVVVTGAAPSASTAAPPVQW